MTADLGTRPGNGAGTAGGTGASVLVDSTPYPWPWDGHFRGDRCALLILQASDPALPVDDPAWTMVGQLVVAVVAAGGLVVEVDSTRPPRLGRAHPGQVVTEPAPIGPRFAGSLVVTASAWDAFFETGLDRVLRTAGRDQLLLVGGWLEVGVHSTMRSANDRGYECLLVPGACIAADEVTRRATVSSTEMSGGIFGAVAGPAGALPLFRST